jgi:hypothetical protein
MAAYSRLFGNLATEGILMNNLANTNIWNVSELQC